MASGAVCHKEDIVCVVRLSGGKQGRASGVRDGRGWQTGDDIGVPRRLGAQFAAPQTPAQGSLPLGDAINDRRVGLQTHALVQAVHKDARHHATLFGNGGLFFDDGCKRQQVFWRFQRQIRGAFGPGFCHPARLLGLHPFQDIGAAVADDDLIGIGRQSAFGRHLGDLPLQNLDGVQR